MAWVEQTFEHNGLRVKLETHSASFNEYCLWLVPKTQTDAHAWAMMLRKAARRLEEIGKGLE